ncbi:MAG: sulfur carrier protein ThiS [Candidatus Aureabacteria bacterium]|nr:sulfur carrier protein ThiS [Candidatus Auribacterota bacterium]
MQIVINGEKTEVEEGTPVSSLLERYHLDPSFIVTEVNSIILAKEQYGSSQLKEGDRVELIRFMGGG